MKDFTAQTVPAGWSERCVEVAGRSYRLTVPADPEAVLEQAAQRYEEDPFWAEIWPAAIPTASIIARRAWSDHPTPCLELGCGAGLVGIVAHAAGLQVTATDMQSIAVQLAAHNAQQNELKDFQTQVLDWSRDKARTYLLVIAADILYERRSHSSLLSFLQSALLPGGQCWIGDPGRSQAKEFVAAAESAGWDVRLYDEDDVAVSDLPVGRFRLIRLQRFSTHAHPGLGHS